MFDADLYAQHVNATGHTLLTANGALICGAAESQSFPQCHSMMQAAPYTAMMVWHDQRNSMQIDIYATRVIGVDGDGPGAPVVSSPTHPDPHNWDKRNLEATAAVSSIVGTALQSRNAPQIRSGSWGSLRTTSDH